MLRPEQLRLAPASPTDLETSPEAACHGRVTAVEFGGAVCKVAVTLLNGHAQDSQPALLVHSPSLGLPAIDAHVRITVSGKAHVFAT